MKKTSKPASKKPAAKKAAPKKTSAKPKRKAAGQGDLAQVVAQLAMSAEKLAQAADRLVKATLQNSQQDEANETPRQSTDQKDPEVTDATLKNG